MANNTFSSMKFVLDEDIHTNDVEYFFSLHGPRFENMNLAMAKSLSQKFGKEFRPIRILNAWPSKRYATANYIVLNQQAYELARKLKRPVVYLPDYEDVNVEFAQSPFIKQIADRLLKKQKTIYVYPFTTAFLKLPSQMYSVLGPSSKLATKFDNKANQMKLFKQLGLPCNKVRIYKNHQELLKQRSKIIPSYLSAAYTSGGSESGLVYSPTRLNEILARLRKINNDSQFVVAEIFENIVLAPNVTALITNAGEVYILSLTDQILNGNHYLGNIYPSVATKKHRKEIHDITTKIGKYLAGQGYCGLFGCDFLINKAGRLVVIDLNPRHQGGYACNSLALAKLGISLTDFELATHLGEAVKLSQAKLDKDLGFAWLHSKIAPSNEGQMVQKETFRGSIDKTFSSIGSDFASEFYQKGSIFIAGYIGYYVQSGKSRDKLVAQAMKRIDQFRADVLED